MQRVLAGDREAYRWLVEEHQPSVLGLCRRLLGGDATEAEDLSQETFVRAYCRLEQLDDPHRFTPWVFQIARSLCLERLRRRAVERRALARRAERLEDESRGGDVVPEVESVLDELPAEEREVLELRYFDGMSYKELQAKLGLSFSRVDHLIRKARMRLERRVQARIQRDGCL